MAKLTEAEKEACYDAERSGAVWDQIIDIITSDPWEPILAITDDPQNDGKPSDDALTADEETVLDLILARQQGQQFTADDQAIIDWTLSNADQVHLPDGREIPIVRSHDQAHREERLLRILETIAAMDEPAKSEAFGYMEGVLDGIRAQEPVPATSLDDEQAEDEEDETDFAAWDAANHQKVIDLVTAAMDGNAATLFSDTLPGEVNGVPIEVLVGMSIGAALQCNQTALGITREQLFRILEIAVNPIIEQYLITPARRMQLLWDGQ